MKNECRILYLSLNDGSDTRIVKEVNTLSTSGARLDFLGIGDSKICCFVAAADLNNLYFVRGRRRSLFPLLRYFARCTYLLLRYRYHSVHVVNEPQLILLWPFLWFQHHVVADIFDSLFLRRNLPKNRWAMVKKLLFLPIDRIVVTDSNRFRLSADWLKYKTFVLPNFPLLYRGPSTIQRSSPLSIMYFGSLGLNRGTGLLQGLLDTGLPMQVLAAGWIADNETRGMLKHPSVNWLGTLTQSEVTHVVATQSDFILCVYAPVNENNINASPNKIFDAIQTEKPVIINPETRVSDFVRHHSLGYVLSSYQVSDFDTLYDELVRFKDQFIPNVKLKNQTTWEQVEKVLISAHNLP